MEVREPMPAAPGAFQAGEVDEPFTARSESSVASLSQEEVAIVTEQQQYHDEQPKVQQYHVEQVGQQQYHVEQLPMLLSSCSTTLSSPMCSSTMLSKLANSNTTSTATATALWLPLPLRSQ